MNSRSKNQTVVVHFPVVLPGCIQFHMNHDDGTMSIDLTTERGTLFLNLSRESATDMSNAVNEWLMEQEPSNE